MALWLALGCACAAGVLLGTTFKECGLRQIDRWLARAYSVCLLVAAYGVSA